MVYQLSYPLLDEPDDVLVHERAGNLHRLTIANINRYMVHHLPRSYYLQPRSSLPLDNYSIPIPDIAVIEGSMDDHLDHTYFSAALVIEVALESLAYDRGPKLNLYAKTGVLEYWIVNLRDATIEVHRDLHPLVARYRQQEILRRGDVVRSPFDGTNIPVEELFLERAP